MTKTEFTLLVNEILNEYDCKLLGMKYNNEGICRVSFNTGEYNTHFYVPYRFMNRARIKLILLDELVLLTPIDPELDLGF